MNFGISVFLYYRWTNTGGTEIPNRYNVVPDTDTKWMMPNDFFDIFEFPVPTKDLHNMYVQQGHPSPYLQCMASAASIGEKMQLIAA